MGVKARPAAVEAIRQRVNQVSGHPAMGQVFRCLGGMAAGAAYTAVRVLGQRGERNAFIVFFFSR